MWSCPAIPKPRNEPLHRPSTKSTALAALAITLVAGVIAIAPVVSAQTSDAPDPSQTSAALPFIGEFQVWCTDRNPAPFNLCRTHHGSPAIDIGMPIGAPLYATGSGDVIIADDICTGPGPCNNRAGNYVAILHPDGTYSRYLHLDEVAVVVGQQVEFGDLIGTNGVTGHSSSPHLHYDEQFPLGTRIDFGTFVGCVDGERVEYPAAFGTDDWNKVEYGSLLVNDGFDCHGDDAPSSEEPTPQEPPAEELAQSSAPRLLPGPDTFALTAPSDLTDAPYEVSVSFDGEEAAIEQITGTELLIFEAFGRSAEIRGRLIIDGIAQAWSAPITFTPEPTSTQATCAGLYASQSSLDGTPQADILIGTRSSDTINGFGGDDIICSGDNTGRGLGPSIFGGTRPDTISGGDGSDLIISGTGRHTIDGGNGTDRCVNRTSFGKTLLSCELDS